MRIGLIARCDNTGLGNQTLELARMLNPHKILLINSSPFHRTHKQYPQRYKDYSVQVVNGVPQNSSVLTFIASVDVIISCETFYHPNLVGLARRRGRKTILQYNFEFLDNISSDRAVPDVLLAPSPWRIDEVKQRFDKISRVEFLPPPTRPEPFSENRNNNLQRHNRLLHIGGKAAIHDRNGTNSVIEMLKYSKAEYELVIKSQTELKLDTSDSRITVDVSNNDSYEDMYNGFDAMILPRRYAGLCLPMNESLMSGLPAFMTDISPNNEILPKKWLAKSEKTGEFMSKSMLDIYNADPKKLSSIVDNYFNSDMKKEKQLAYEIGYNYFSPENLRDRYLDIIENL